MLQNGGVNATVIPPTQSCFLVADYLDPNSQYFVFAINGEDGTAATGPDLDVWLRFSALYSGAQAAGLVAMNMQGSAATKHLAGTGNCYTFYNALPSATHGATPLPQSAVRTTRSPAATPASPSPSPTTPSTPGVTSPSTPGVTSPSTPGVTSPTTPGVTSPSPTTTVSPATGSAGSAGGCGGSGGQGKPACRCHAAACPQLCSSA